MEESTPPPPDLRQPLPAENFENQPPQQSIEQPPAGPEKWTRTRHPRGRQAKDPLGVSIRYHCSSMESMEAQLRDYIASPTGPIEHTTLEFCFPTSAAFMVFSGDFHGSKEAFKAKSMTYPTLSRTAISVVDALSQMEPKEQLRKQKAIAKAIVDSVQSVDGHRYSFHNNWVSKEDEACRFSYYCNDSTLNKGRAANEGAGMTGKKKVKPVYDCNGIVHIKFSVTKQSLEVHYKHIPLHKTYEERAPPPRRDSKRRKFLELFAPEKLPKPGEKRKNPKEPKELKERRPRKKRRATEPISGATDETLPTNGDNSLAPLIDFLGAAGKEISQLPLNSDPPQANRTSELPLLPTEKTEALKPDKPRAPRPKAPRRASSHPRPVRLHPSNIPGTMAGFLVGDNLEIQWGHERDEAHHQAPTSTTEQLTISPLAGIAAAAAAEVSEQTVPDPASELDSLKQKLFEAEQRIQRLEAEQQRPAMGPPGWPPPAPPGPLPGYGYPHPNYGHSPYPPLPPPAGQYLPQSQQYQYPPPQQHQQQQQQPPPLGHNDKPHHGETVNRQTQGSGAHPPPQPVEPGERLPAKW